MVYTIYGLYEPTGAIRYIGYTSKGLKERLKSHLGILRPSKAVVGRRCHRICWLQSLKDKGFKPIIREIDTTDTLEKALCLEVYWISTYRKTGADLTNSTNGGEGVPGIKWNEESYKGLYRKVHQYNLKGTLICTYKSLTDASTAITGSKRYNGKISGVCRGKFGRRTFKGFVFRYDGDDFNKYPTTGQWNVTEQQRKDISKRQRESNVMAGKVGIKHPRSVAINQYSLDDVFIQSYDCIQDAKRILGLKHLTMSYTSSNGFIWKYASKDIVRSSEKSESSN